MGVGSLLNLFSLKHKRHLESVCYYEFTIYLKLGDDRDEDVATDGEEKTLLGF